MKRPLLLICCLFTLVSCFVQTKFETSTAYTDTQKPSSVFMIVVGDKETSKCLQYYKEYLADTLKKNNIKVDSYDDYRVTANNNSLAFINELIEANKGYPYILVSALKKSVVGYGTSSSRTLKLALINTADKKTVWSGDLKADFSWFINDDNYRAVAKKMSWRVITELKAKGIVQ